MATRKTRAAPITEAPTETKVIAYKGFNPDWTCNPNGVAFQYEVGKTYTHDGKVEACASGFHACEMPLDVWNYYKPNSSKFAVVEAAGKIARHDGKDSKIASATITVQAEIKLPDLIKRAVQWVLDRARSNTETGYSGHAAATGHSGHAAATGNSGHAAATGNYGHAAATGGYGCAFAGFGGRAKASINGSFAIAWRDESTDRARLIVGTPGENGIKPDTFYRVVDGALVEE